jgi:predicted RNase H-like HicB family nuclease
MSEIRHLPVDVEIDEDGIYIVSCPAFKACHADGKTIDAALINLVEVIEMCLEEQSYI